jgi:hypothetical protein
VPPLSEDGRGRAARRPGPHHRHGPRDRGDGGARPARSTLYFTGGSTGLRLLVDGMAAGFAAARVTGDRFASVATGLALHARRLFGAT